LLDLKFYGVRKNQRPASRAGEQDSVIYGTTRKNTLLMAEILSPLRDGGELSLMNGDNNPDGINLPRLRLLFFGIGKTHRVTS